MSNLIDRRHRETRDLIAHTATALFTRQGYDETTMEAVAQAAGVSRRTAYRHFPQKHDLLFNHPQLWLEHFDEIVTTRTADEPTRHLCRRGLLSVAQLIQDRGDRVLAAWAVVQSTPSLRGQIGSTQDEWLTRYVGLIQADRADPEAGLLEATIMAGCLVAATNALVAVWALEQPGADMVAMTEAALDYIDHLWPAETRPEPGQS